MRELPAPRPTFVLARGAYDAPTETVTPGTPHALGDLPAGAAAEPARPRALAARSGASADRAGDRSTATGRMLFGRGLVATPADFGSQGRLPTHPELLDWLATTFVAVGVGPEGAAEAHRDVGDLSAVVDRRRRGALAPIRQNEWLARGPSYRLSAEQIRDGALAASGLLVDTIGGPSVYPYQPAGLWEALATRNATTYEQGKGDELHRRSLYTVWKRSSPPPSAISFDAAERLFCTVSRQRTNTPLQALVLLNDPQYVEAARALAERMMREGGADAADADRVRRSALLTSRRAARRGAARCCETLYRDEQAGVPPRRARRAAKLLAVGEHPPRPRRSTPAEPAAYTVVATTLLNFDEAVMKR